MKKWQVGMLLVGSIFLAGCSKAQAPTAENVMPEAPAAAEEGGMVSSIMDAMNMGKTMECTYKAGEGAQAAESTVTVQGKKFKSSSSMNGVRSYALSDGNDIYIWSSANSQGMQMSQGCIEDMKKNLPASAASQVPQDPQESFDTAENVACKEVGSADFSVPANITFADQCAMMQKSMEMMKDLPQMPTGYAQ